MKFRPEADIWPVMSDDELKALATDIDTNGQQYAISLYQDAILDGRNRWLAITRFCKKNTKPLLDTVNPESPIAFIISRNEKRRHLNSEQRGYCAARALPFFEAEAKKRMAEGGKQKGAPIGAGLEKPPHRAADDAARAFDTSPRNVQRAKSVKDKGSKKLNEAVAQGRLSLGKAEEITKKYPDKAKQDAQVINIAKSKNATRVKGLTGEFEWYTPRKYLDAAIAVMGAIDLDPASSERAQEHVKAKTYYTLENNGLTKRWLGRVFLNPPYGMPTIREFVNKMIESWQSGDMREGILLTNNATDTEWFHNVLEACSASALCLTRGRISFLESSSDGELIEKTSPTHGQAFFYFGPNIDTFAEIFSGFGAILIRHHSLTQMTA